MKCQQCGAEIPEGKIYCEKCGSAIQMVPDYNPVDDISIGTEERPKPKPPDKEEVPKQEPGRCSFWKYGIVAVCLIVAGSFAYQKAYEAILEPEETVAEPEEEEVLLEKPVFSMAPGTYDYSPQLILSYDETENGIIYYTIDGSTPDEGSPAYNRPIEIGEGTTIIRAVFVRSDGVRSEEAYGTYEVVFDYPDDPRFSVGSGEFTEPFTVSISAEAGCRIYYTTNGDDPDRYSSLYRGPVSIDPGVTILRAVAIDMDGGESAITEATYKVEENPNPEALPPDQIPEVIP